MTPAERIAAALWRGARVTRELAQYDATSVVSDLLAHDYVIVHCPKGERVVLDRTGDTDRLVKQRIQGVDWETITYAWVDVDSDGAS